MKVLALALALGVAIGSAAPAAATIGYAYRNGGCTATNINYQDTDYYARSAINSNCQKSSSSFRVYFRYYTTYTGVPDPVLTLGPTVTGDGSTLSIQTPKRRGTDFYLSYHKITGEYPDYGYWYTYS